MKKLAAAAVLVGILVVARLAGFEPNAPATAPAVETASQTPTDDAALLRAIQTHADDVPVQGSGRVDRIFADDNDGSRHQRFLVRLASGDTILIAHNIDLAPRVAPLAQGDTVSFSGEFAWNPKGGVVHWTHHDPAGRHPGGWIRRDGQTFQ